MSAADARWAKKQKAGGSGRKAVLMMLAHLADKNSEARASVAEISAACEMSADVVKDHLNHLAAIGLIERQARFNEDSGRAANAIRLSRKPRQRRDAAPRPQTSADFGQWGRA